MSAALNGVLLLDKPVGLSSNALLQIVRRLAGGLKAGHGGSLDPLASGMLPICLGEATRLSSELLGGRKAYRFLLKLGERSATGDAEGAVIERCPVPSLTRGEIEAALSQFRGPQLQVPPMYSALKHHGQPLYRLARRGMTVERAPRALHIEALELLSVQADRLELSVLCSKGTYVRVLGEDIARALGSCGRLESLRRLYVEPFAHERMVALEELERHECTQWPVLAPDRAVPHLPAVHVHALAARALSQGQVLPYAQASAASGSDTSMASISAQLCRLYDEQGRFLGLGATDACGRLKARRLFSSALLM